MNNGAGPLFVLLCALTVCDLGFVHATGVVTGVQLWPLWLLTAGAPWLRRLQRHALYRRAWNGAVIVAFALLVHHATTTGLLHMLEDGLVLAILCQVHLLNNVGDRQRPDLIFFNSFLIAFVTSFFAPDAAWSVLFVAHAFVLVPGLQLHTLLRGSATIDGTLVRAVLRDSVPRTAIIGALAAVVFLVCPRDFRREGWLGQTGGLHDTFQAGLAEQIRIDDERSMRLAENVVAHLTPASGRPEDVPQLWRANVYSSFDGGAWSPQRASTLGSRFATDPPWHLRPDGSWQRDASANVAAALVRVRLDDWTSHRAPTPLGAVCVVMPDTSNLVVDTKGSGCFTVTPIGRQRRPLLYEVACAAGAGAVTPSPRTRQHFTTLPDRVPASVYALADQLRGSLPDGAGDLATAEAAAQWLQQNRRYQLPGGPGFARNLGEFLLGSGAGHCEYFATSLGLLLRALDVPCRLTGGWLAHEWNVEAGAVIVRGKHAHAWVEVLDTEGRWHSFDPTPPTDVMDDGETAKSWWQSARAELEHWWIAVTGFDGATQAQWLAWLRALPSSHPFTLAGAVVLVAALLVHRRRRRQIEPTIVEFERAMRAAKVSLRTGETPREMLARASSSTIDGRLLMRLRDAAQRHEAARYATSAAD